MQLICMILHYFGYSFGNNAETEPPAARENRRALHFHNIVFKTASKSLHRDRSVSASAAPLLLFWLKEQLN